MADDKLIQEAHRLRETNKDASKICTYWPLVLLVLEFLRSLPIPDQVKEAIDIIIKF